MDADNDRMIELLDQVRQGDAAAIKRLYLLCSVVYPHVLRLCRDPVLARDVHHDTVTEIWKGGARFRGESKFSTWVIAIARNLAFNALRKRGREPLHWPEPEAAAEGELHDDPQAYSDADAGHDPPTDADPSHTLEARQRREGVQRCIGKLSPKLGECLLLVYYAEMSQSEVASLLGLNINTVKARIRDAQLRIENCLGRVLHGGMNGR